MKKTMAVLVMVMMAVGFDWSLPQRSNDTVQITLKNQFSVAVGFYVNDTFACTAPANSSCTVRVNIRKAPFKLEAWNFNNKVIASRTLDTLAPGKDIIWATGNVERNPIPPPAVAKQIAQDSTKSPQTAPKGADVSFVMSVTTLNHQGQRDQFLAKRTSLAKIERQKTPGGATYTLSGEGGMRIGRKGEPVFYYKSPVVVSRGLPDDRLSCEQEGLNAWFAVINLTMNGLTHKGQHIRSGAWEDSIVLPQDDGFPKMIKAQFSARPLPEPDNRWILVTADSGVISFRALDVKFQDSLIYGRYRGVLVYSPDEDKFLESAAAFTLYRGQDQFRIEQIQYAADAEGNQLLPLPDLGDHLDFTPKKANPSPQGSLPSWCAQSAILFNLLHLTSMSAAEGSTNPGWVATVEQWILDFIQHEYTATEKILGRAAADELLGDWMKCIDTWKTGKTLGFGKALWDLGWDHAKNLYLAALPYNIGRQHQILEFSRDVADATVEEIDAGVKTLGHNLQPILNPSPPSAEPVDLTKPKAPTASKPPVEQPKKVPFFQRPEPPLILLGGALVAGGLYYLNKKAGADSGGDGSSFPITVTNHCSQGLTMFKVNGIDYGPINAGTTKNFSVSKTGSCTTIRYEWMTSRGFSYSSWGKFKTSCGFIFSDNYRLDMAPISGVQVGDCD